MLLRWLALGVVFVAVAPARADDRGLPADVTRDIEAVAVLLDESLRCLKRDDLLRQEVLWLALDLRLHAIRYTLRGAPDHHAERLADWATRLERTPTTRWHVRMVCDELTNDLDRRRVREFAAELVAAQDAITRAIYAQRWDYPPHYDQGWTEPSIGEVPLVVVEKGKSVTVRHAIRWRQYPGDTVRVALVASAAGLTFPAELTLDFEKHSLEFEYEITGVAVGEYTIVLTPVVGQPVKVSVSVK
jgi:hypothetical protein